MHPERTPPCFPFLHSDNATQATPNRREIRKKQGAKSQIDKMEEWILTGVPLSSTSRSRALTFCSSMLGASGSKRPSFCAFFQASTLSLRCSYSSGGITYFWTEETSVKSVRAAAGRVSSTCPACAKRRQRWALWEEITNGAELGEQAIQRDCSGSTREVMRWRIGGVIGSRE